MLGKDKNDKLRAESKEFLQLWNRRKKDGSFVYDGTLRSEGSAEVGEGITPGRGRTDTTEIDTYLEGKFTTEGRKGTFLNPEVSENIDFRDEDFEVAKQINDTFSDDRVPINARAVGSSARGQGDVGSGFADLVEIRIDGYNKPPLTIPADYNTDGDARKAENEVREYIKAYLVTQQRGGGGVGSRYN